MTDLFCGVSLLPAYPGRLRNRLQACCALSSELLARIVRRMAELSMSPFCNIVVCSAVILSCNISIASETGEFISRCQARPRDVRLVLRLGIDET